MMHFYFFFALFSVAFTGIVIWKYQRTRDAGFLWLGAALVIWPMVQGAIQGAVIANRIISKRTVETGFTFSNTSLWIVGASLQIVAVLYLHRTKAINNQDLP